MSEDAEARRPAVMAGYGSRIADLAPCDRETRILAAVAPWRIAQAPPLDRWTDTLGGWFGSGAQHAQAPAHVVDAIRGAYPMPATVAEAAAEHAYWEARNAELEALLGPAYDAGGGRFLDLPADIRAALVRDLAEHGLPARTLDELRARFALFRARGARDGAAMEAAMMRDLEAIDVVQAAVPSLADQIAAALREHPEAADREIARTIGCAGPTVAKVRRSIGLADVVRSVRRGGQAYPMKARGAAR